MRDVALREDALRAALHLAGGATALADAADEGGSTVVGIADLAALAAVLGVGEQIHAAFAALRLPRRTRALAVDAGGALGTRGAATAGSGSDRS